MLLACTEPSLHATELMSAKLVSLGPDDSVADARRLFDEHGFHHLLVVERGQLVGILSDRDLLRNLSPFVDKMAERPQDLALLNRRVHQIMAREPITLPHNARIDEAAALMHIHDVSCLPIVDDDGRPIGILTRTDLLRGLAACLLPPDNDESLRR
ncbi:MAG: CBS domain-containing protein [Planctomycetota bacterium]